MVYLYGLSDIGFNIKVGKTPYKQNQMTSISAGAFKFQVTVQIQDIIASGMICCPCPLGDILK